MTQPSEEEVRAGLVTLAHTHPALGMLAVEALRLLDAGRKDRERLDWLEHQSEYGRVALDTNNPEFDNSEPKYTVYASAKGGRKFGDTLRAAIDQARGA